MITIFVGDVSEYLGILAKATDPLAQLITKDNYQNLLPGTYYVSLGDLNNVFELENIFKQADVIEYSQPLVWTNKSMKELTELSLTNFYYLNKNIKGFEIKFAVNPAEMLALADTRKTSNEQLWIAGCSISHGMGVNNNIRYGQLIADNLMLPVSFLTCGGSSVVWAADQILRSDIRANDIVVWGLTSQHRVSYFLDGRVNQINPGVFVSNPATSKFVKPDQLLSDDILYRSITSTFQVINFCHKLNVHLIIAILLDSVLHTYLLNHENLSVFQPLLGVRKDKMFLDLGTDNIHPGPITHKYYADKILERILNL